jgi:hypothetical protein
VDQATDRGTYTQGTVHGAAELTQHGTTTAISANGNNLELTGVKDKNTNQFLETAPFNATGSFQIAPTLAALKHS